MWRWRRRWGIVAASVVVLAVSGLLWGRQLPPRYIVTAAQDLPDSTARIWARVGEPAAVAHWHPEIIDAEPVNGRALAKQSWRVRFKDGDSALAEELERRPPYYREVRYRGAGPPWPVRRAYRILEIPGGARLTVTEAHTIGNPWLRLVARYALSPEERPRRLLDALQRSLAKRRVQDP